MIVRDIIEKLEQFAPLSLQEQYDNSGLLVGSASQEVCGVLIAIDVIEDVVIEAIAKGANLIICHHPIIFSGLKRLTDRSYVERTVRLAIKHDIAIYAAHTNLDNISKGVNHKICQKLGLINTKILVPLSQQLVKLVVFVPSSYAEQVRIALFEGGGGNIGNYDCCSFNVNGSGSFRANENATPFVGEKGKLHVENEVRIEIIVPKGNLGRVVKKMVEVHPYEEVAYDVYPLANNWETAGAGMIGFLDEELSELAFLEKVKETFNAKSLRYTRLIGKEIKKVAVCGGSGANFLSNAIQAGADVFITADFKYHQFFDADGKIVIAEIGHFESEQFTKEIFYELLMKNFTNFAIHLSEVNTNPINYL
jgi:dinuclear metal center YbgI/SA1388 family protein